MKRFILYHINPFTHLITPRAIVDITNAFYENEIGSYSNISNVADALHEKYPNEFEPYYNKYLKINEEWWNVRMRPFREVYRDLVDDEYETLRNEGYNKVSAKYYARVHVKDILSSLPKYELKYRSK